MEDYKNNGVVIVNPKFFFEQIRLTLNPLKTYLEVLENTNMGHADEDAINDWEKERMEVLEQITYWELFLEDNGEEII